MIDADGEFLLGEQATPSVKTSPNSSIIEIGKPPAMYRLQGKIFDIDTTIFHWF